MDLWRQSVVLEPELVDETVGWTLWPRNLLCFARHLIVAVAIVLGVLHANDVMSDSAQGAVEDTWCAIDV